MKATITLIARLQNPEGVWTNIEEIDVDSQQALDAKIVFNIAKIVGEGGILENSAPHVWSFIAMARLVNIEAKGVLQLIQVPTSKESAIIRDPNSPLQFRNKKAN